jgi:putative endonuclease
MSSLSKTLYAGVTNDLERGVFEHKAWQSGSSTIRQKVDRLVYFEEFGDISQAIAREKKIKRMTRRVKDRLIKSMNPDWHDLSGDWQWRSIGIRVSSRGSPARE